MRLFLLLTLVPLSELFVMISVHRAIADRWGQGTGLLVTLGSILVTGLVGAWLARRQGLRALRELQGALERGESPGRPLVDGALIVLGGAMLLAPGYLTDLLGLSLLVPWTRGLYRRALLGWFGARVAIGRAAFGVGPFPGEGDDRPRPAEEIVIDVTPEAEREGP